MFIESGGAPPAMFIDTTPQPMMNLDTTQAYRAYDTTGPDIQTAIPWQQILPTGGSNPADFLEQIGLRLVTFGKAFDSYALDTGIQEIITETTPETPTQTGRPEQTTSADKESINLPETVQQINPHNGPNSIREMNGGRAGVVTYDQDLMEQILNQLNGGGSEANQTDDDPRLEPIEINECPGQSPFPFCDATSCSNFGLTIYVAFQILLLVLIVASNLTIISVINDMNRNSRNRSSKSNNIFKLSLAIGDLFLGLSILPGGIQQSVSALIDIQSFNPTKIYLQRAASFNSIPAIIFGGGAVMATIIGIWSILMMKIDLFLRIKFPLRHNTGKFTTTNRSRAVVIFLWLLAIGMVVVLWKPLGFSWMLSPITLTYAPALPITADDNSNIMILVYALLVWGLPFLATIPLGGYLLVTISQARKKLHLRSQASYIKRHSEHTERKNQNRRDWEAICRLVTVELVYVITFLPILVSHFVYYKYGKCNKHAILMNFISLYILIAGSFVNLFVYHLMWKEFQVKLRSLFCGNQVTAHRSQVSTIHSGANTSATLDNHNSTQITVTFEIPSS
jgi:hypothetical protein